MACIPSRSSCCCGSTVSKTIKDRAVSIKVITMYTMQIKTAPTASCFNRGLSVPKVTNLPVCMAGVTADEYN